LNSILFSLAFLLPSFCLQSGDLSFFFLFAFLVLLFSPHCINLFVELIETLLNDRIALSGLF
jgi:hypothetical protein